MAADILEGPELAGLTPKQLFALAKKERELTDFLSRVKPVIRIEEKEVEWLVPRWIPKGEITLLAGDGGIGKTSIWCRILSEITRGEPCFLQKDDMTVPESNRLCLFFSGEDSVGGRLKEHFALYGADQTKLITMEQTSENRNALRKLTFTSDELRALIVGLQPAICVFDPIQAFLPERFNMNSRNGIRSCMEALATLGKTYKTAFLLVAHTNKRESSSGRNRISNSADLWDAARSVIMTGYAGDANDPSLKYLSNEKNNYAPLQETVLYTISGDEGVRITGTTAKREADFLREIKAGRKDVSHKINDCANAILALLEDAEENTMKTAVLDRLLQDEGFSLITLKRAKAYLSAQDQIEYFHTGFGENTTYHIRQKQESPVP